MKTQRFRILGIAVLCAACLASASLPAQSNDLALAEYDLNDANNAFAVRLLEEIAAKEPGRNIFISPFSVSTAMQMVSEGAAGATKSEIQAVLKTGNLPAAQLNLAYGRFYNWLQDYEKPRLKLANGIWYQSKYRVKRDFAAVIHDSFQAELAPADFDDPATADDINLWARKHTEGRVSGIVSFPFPKDTEMVLANAIYFKGKWQDPFDKSKTEPRDFYLPDGTGTAKKMPMMAKHDNLSYMENNDFQAVQLDYEGGLQMSIFLPKGHTDPGLLLPDFAHQTWAEFTSGFSPRDGWLVLPKFKFEYEILLNGPLKSLGIKQAFDAYAADFSPMTVTGPLYISKITQKSFVAVDEEGTEAAAITAINAVPTLGMPEKPPKPFKMIVDHPFLFVISAWGPYQTQVILFIGIVNEPVGE